MRRAIRHGLLALALATLAACATGLAVRNAQTAAKRGDWDTAVVYYREALSREPNRVDIRVGLDRAMREASGAHLKRARDLEAQDQLSGAAAEYRLASDLDPSNTLAFSKALGIEKAIRAQVEAARPKPRIDEMRSQAQQSSPIPQLDPRVRIPLLRFPQASVRDILDFIAAATGINISYDQVVPQLNQPYTVNLTDVPLEQALQQVMTANQLTYTVLNSRAILVYADTPQNRQKYEPIYLQNFYISNGSPDDINQLLQQMVQQGAPVRPQISLDKTARVLSVKATAPVMKVIEQIITAHDKPLAEVIVDVEILEVDRQKLKQVGLDLANFAVGLAFSPEVTPAPGTSTQFNLNTLRGGVSAADMYVTTPTANIKFLEQLQSTRVLAKTQLRGREGAALVLQLGDRIPYATATFSPAQGQTSNFIPSTINYQPIGVNVTMTPKVTYQDEIILENMQIDKSALGLPMIVQGQQQPSFTNRTANVTLRLRDGESNLIAGLFREEDRKTWKTFPGLSQIPVLRSLLGNLDGNLDRSEVVMLVTPHIIRSHDITTDDLKPVYIGTFNNIGMSGSVPPLLAPDSPPPPATVPLTGPLPAGSGGAAPTQTPPAGAAATSTPPPAATNPRAVNVVPIQPVGPGGATPDTKPATRFVVGAPSAEFVVGGGPYTVPIQVENASQMLAASITITYNPAVLKATTVTGGPFLQQGGIMPTFVPKIDAVNGRIDIAISRPNDPAGMTGTGVLAAVLFEPVAPGSSPIAITATGATASGSISAQMVPATATVKK